jgi:hypothetical protein
MGFFESYANTAKGSNRTIILNVVPDIAIFYHYQVIVVIKLLPAFEPI